MAVRAQQDALRELGLDPRPAARGTFRRDRELLPAGLEVVKLERGNWLRPAATAARSAHRSDRALLCPLAELHHRVATIDLLQGVSRAMTVSAYEDALVGLTPRSINAAEEAAEGELLIPRVAVMELQCPDAPGIPAVFAPTTSLGDQPRLDLDPTPTAVPSQRLEATRTRGDEWPSRAVVPTERRTGGAE